VFASLAQLVSHAAWWQWVAAVWVLAYFPALGLLGIGFRRLARAERLDDARCMPVTVLVSARNEERDLPACLASLFALDYPADKLQIVLVDDLSTDSTGRIIDAAAAVHRHVVAAHTAALPANGLEAKARGIAHGFARATGEWVLITDADATVHPQWIRFMLGRVADDTGMVGGVLAVEPDGLVGRIECVSWAYSQLFNLGMAGWNAPIVCSGPNMAMRRSVYVEAGGLEQATFRVAEDLALFQMVTRRGLRVQCLAEPETTATLRPVPTFRHLLSQQRRWLAGGIAASPAYSGPLLAAFWWGAFVAVYAIAGWALGVRGWLAFLVAKGILDTALMAYEGVRLGRPGLVRHVWVLELYQAFIFLLLPPSFLVSRKVHWMGDGYTVTYRG
jgi:1,2-diacylglycerol 3-beta-glucosyltransferase